MPTEKTEAASALQAALQAAVLAREQAEAALAEVRQALEVRTRELSQAISLMQATFNSSADGILVTDAAGRIVTFNSRFLDVWRVGADQVEGADHQQFVNRAAVLLTDEAAQRARLAEIHAGLRTEALDTLDFIDGRVFERLSRPQVIDGGTAGRVWVFREVTDRRRAEEAARDEARMLDQLNQTWVTIASTLDLSVVLQTVTDAATQLSGAAFGAFFYTTTDESGQSLLLYTLSGAPRNAFERFGPPRATPLFGPTFRGEPPVRCDDVLTDPRYGQWGPHKGMPQGHPTVRSFLTVPVISRSGEPIGGLFFGHPQVGVFTARAERLVVGIAAQASVAIDNARQYEETKRLAAERERLVEAERAARIDIARVSRMKDEFLATLSHELRSPLSAILGWVKVLVRSKDDADILTRGLSAIDRNAAAQARLIGDLLDMNQIVSGKVRLDVQPTDVGGVIDAACEAIRPAADAKAIRLHKAVDPRAGPVSADPARLQQVLWNLLTNAVKFTPQGGRIELVLQRVGSHIEISVSDSGVGISAEFLPHVFDRFRQADSSTTRQHGGLGLGLSIVKQLVELHGGAVAASSAGHGGGARFTVSLPLAALPRDAEPGCVSVQSGAGALVLHIDLKGVKVLVVDDEPDARDLLAHLLQECKADVVTASSAVEALAALQRDRPDVLVSDIGMPERDGFQLVRDIRRLEPGQGGRTAAIALTAFARPEDRTRAMLAGYQVHLSKPVEPYELLATVASLAGRVKHGTDLSG